MKNTFIQAGNQRVQIRESDDATPKIILEGPGSDGQNETLTFSVTDTGKSDAKAKVTEMIANGIASEETKGHDFIDQL